MSRIGIEKSIDIVYKRLSDGKKEVAVLENAAFHGSIFFTVVVERKIIDCELEEEFLEAWNLTILGSGRKVNPETKKIPLASLSDVFWNSEQITSIVGDEAVGCAIASAICQIYKH